MLSLAHFRCFCVVVVAVCRCLGPLGGLSAGEDVQLHSCRLSQWRLTPRNWAEKAVGERMSGTAELQLEVKAFHSRFWLGGCMLIQHALSDGGLLLLWWPYCQWDGFISQDSHRMCHRCTGACVDRLRVVSSTRKPEFVCCGWAVQCPRCCAPPAPLPHFAGGTQLSSHSMYVQAQAALVWVWWLQEWACSAVLTTRSSLLHGRG
jgi:hypothetical protein